MADESEPSEADLIKAREHLHKQIEELQSPIYQRTDNSALVQKLWTLIEEIDQLIANSDES
jgi:uncharacterized protein HemX